jgi:hypothetical protein
MKNFEGKNSVILIGNGPSAVSWRAGSIIDRFDIVVRFNRFSVKGYEPWVGSKTDIWVVNGPDYTIDKWASEVDIIYSAPFPLTESDLRYTASLLEAGHMLTILDASVIESTKRYLYSHLLLGHDGTLPYPSTGAIVAYFLLGFFSAVYIHGFDFMQGETHHYFESARREQLLDWHCPSAEKAFFESLITAGRVCLLRHSDWVSS